MPMNVVLLDLDSPVAQDVSAVARTCASYPGLPVVVISGRNEAGIDARAIEQGAAAFVPKSASLAAVMETLQTVRARLSDATPKLTRQQFRVLEMLCSGLKNKQIGVRLNVTEATVKAHMRAIMGKFGANNRTQVVLAAGLSATVRAAHHTVPSQSR